MDLRDEEIQARPGFRAVIGGVIAVAAIALLSVAGTQLFGASTKPEPAMWVMRDSDSTIYLLGTFHLVKPGTEWRTGKIATAFAASDEVWLEATGLTDPANLGAIQGLVLKHGFDRKHPLSSKLDPEAKARLDALALEAGLQPAQLEPMRPWLAALTIAMAPLRQAGYDPAQGVDQVLEQDAKAAHKRLKSFETPEQQLMIFAGLSEDEELGFLRQSLVDAAALTGAFDQLSDAWLSGDLEALNTLAFESMKQASPELHTAMMVRRNIAWSKTIAAMMQGAGTSFIAVGAGHLVGEGNLPVLLAERGLAVERY